MPRRETEEKGQEAATRSLERVGFAGFTLDLTGCTLTDPSARDIPLRRSEFALLAAFLRAPGRVLSRDHLLDAVAGRRSDPYDRSVDVLISRLRRKIEADPKSPRLIVTVPGIGYKFAVLSPARPTHTDLVPAGGQEALAGKARIAVLAFETMGGDQDQSYFSDGVADEIITELSRDRSLFVIARNSSFIYKRRTVKIDQIARELGVRYVLEGTVRREAAHVRLTAKLIDVEMDVHIWAERYDRDLADIFAVQTHIARAVTIAIAPALADAERQRAMRKPPGNLDAWDAYHRGLWHLGQGNAEDNALAEKYFRQAIDLDPTFARGYSGLATAIDRTAVAYRTRDYAEGVSLAESFSRRAIALDDGDAEAHAGLSNRLTSRGDHQGAREEAERAMALNPNLASVYGALGVALTFGGSPRKGAAALEECLRRDPRSPTRLARRLQITTAYYLSGDYGAAVDAAQRILRDLPGRPGTYVMLAAALGQLGMTEEAKAALAEARALGSAASDLDFNNRAPWMRPVDHAHRLEGLRKAGWNG